MDSSGNPKLSKKGHFSSHKKKKKKSQKISENTLSVKSNQTDNLDIYDPMGTEEIPPSTLNPVTLDRNENENAKNSENASADGSQMDDSDLVPSQSSTSSKFVKQKP